MKTLATLIGKIGRWTAPVACLLALALLFVRPPKAEAAGLLIAEGGFGGVLEIVEHDVKVTLNNGIAVTRVNQVFRNTEKRQVEALYTFPVPRGASVANFSMWINGKEMVGEVLEKKRAREIYNSYKRRRKDPGLLEQVDYKTFEMRIFPIAAGAEQRVQITYYQELETDHDRLTYVYPLATVSRPDVDSRTHGKFALTVEAKSAVPLVKIESPSHGEEFVIARHADTYATASLETAGGSLARDVVIACALERARTGIDLITQKPAGEDGYFLMTLTAGKELAKLDGGMDYVFLIDISGSMGNDRKLTISRDAVAAFVEELDDADRFEVMTFNVQPETLFGTLQAVSDPNRQAARDYLDSQRARGGTVLAPAITTAYRYGADDRTLNVVVLSDGMTEQKERRQLMDLIAKRPRNARVFCIGIGNEVNRPLLEQMAEDSGGLAAFVSRGDNFKRQAQAFRRKLMRPAATDLELKIDGLRVHDLEPAVLPNLYHGAPVRLYGRYTGGGTGTVTLTASVQGQELVQSAQMQFPAADETNPEIERMWAWKRIDSLLKKANRGGNTDGVVDEVVRLGETYSIVSEYTSFLVLENDGEYRRWKIERRNQDRISRDRAAQDRRSARLEAIRNRAVADLGPQPLLAQNTAAAAKPTAAKRPAAPSQAPAAPASPASPPARPRNQGFDLNIGTGPVGPLFVGLVWWMRRRKKRD